MSIGFGTLQIVPIPCLSHRAHCQLLSEDCLAQTLCLTGTECQRGGSSTDIYIQIPPHCDASVPIDQRASGILTPCNHSLARMLFFDHKVKIQHILKLNFNILH